MGGWLKSPHGYGVLNRMACIVKMFSCSYTTLFEIDFLLKHNIGNNANIGTRGSTMRKQKKFDDKMLPPVSIELRPLINL